MQIIDIDLQLIKAKSKSIPTLSPAPHLSAAHSPLPKPFSSLPLAPQPLEINDMAGILTEHPRQIPNLYWQPGQPIGASVNHFRQIKYLPFLNAVPDLNQAVSGAKVDRARDLHKQLIQFGGVEQVWITIQFEYEPVIPMANKQSFEQYLSAALTRMFMRDGTISSFKSHYSDSLRILTDQIREFNANFIREKSGFRLARVLQFTLNMVKYAPLERRGWYPLP